MAYRIPPSSAHGDAPYGRDIKEGEIAPEFLTIPPPPKSPQPVKDNLVNPADAEAVQRLKDHDENHQYDYSRAILLKENANARAVKLDAITIGGHSVLDLIENKAIEMTGNWMAFLVPSGSGKDSSAQFLKNRADVQGSDADDHLEGCVRRAAALAANSRCLRRSQAGIVQQQRED